MSKEDVADPTQFDKASEYYDSKASKEQPRWFCPEVTFMNRFPELVALDRLREQKSLEGLLFSSAPSTEA